MTLWILIVGSTSLWELLDSLDGNQVQDILKCARSITAGGQCLRHFFFLKWSWLVGFYVVLKKVDQNTDSDDNWFLEYYIAIVFVSDGWVPMRRTSGFLISQKHVFVSFDSDKSWPFLYFCSLFYLLNKPRFNF